MNIEKAIKNMKLRGFEVSFFENKEAASDYLVSQIKDTSVGIGGSKTVEQMGLYEKLCEAGNDVAWHWKTPGWDTLDRETAAKVFISSANAIAETGEGYWKGITALPVLFSARSGFTSSLARTRSALTLIPRFTERATPQPSRT